MIDIPPDSVCTLKNLRMLLKGPNRDAEPQSIMADQGFENSGNEKCMKEFFTHKLDKTYCIILLKSGTLRLVNCILSLE